MNRPLTTLEINNFSCIRRASVKVGAVTVIIGPQASGKSIVSKLTYFFLDLLSEIFSVPDEPHHFKEVASKISKNFKQWFPPDTWGRKKFEIRFTFGTAQFEIVRTGFNKKPSQNIKFSASETILTAFEEFSDAIERSGVNNTPSSTNEAYRTLERRWKLEEKARERLSKLLFRPVIASQIFIPAGRSFFTSMGKMAAVLEQGGLLEPLTTRFARLYSRAKERRSGPMVHARTKKDGTSISKHLEHSLVGGTIKTSQDGDYVIYDDGRRVPFSLLSSGQQETLPLLLVLEFYGRLARDSVFYIEEPEAHLFPAAQAELTEFLASLVNQTSTRNLFITTHSPYVLTKLNNLLKAGLLSKSLGRETESQIAKVVSKEAWLSPGLLTAYAMQDGETQDLITEDGLIDGAYLDSASDFLSREFMRLLDIEARYE